MIGREDTGLPPAIASCYWREGPIATAYRRGLSRLAGIECSFRVAARLNSRRSPRETVHWTVS